MELHGGNCSRNEVIQQRLQHLWSYARREQQIRRYLPFNDPVTPKMLLSLRITPFLLHSAKMLKWEGSANQREAAALGEAAPRWRPRLMRGSPTQREAPNRCGPLHSVRAPPRNVHRAKRHESNGRTGAVCQTFQLLGTPWGSSEVDGKAPASLPAHSPHTAPRLLRHSPFTCPKVENASQRAGNRARNPARCPLEALGGDASPPQRSPSARADDRTPA